MHALSTHVSKGLIKVAATIAASSLTVLPIPAFAAELPTGGKVVSGTASIAQSAANQLLINQVSEKAILEFDTFSIGKTGQVHFSNGSGSTLNRVTGGYQSKIDGRLTATGSLMLINPNGVIIGREGVIETGGSFLASTRDITNGDFLNGGDNTFFGDSNAAVINLGKVSSLGGDISLFAHKVVNEGTLETKNGTVGLASGIEILLRDNNHADGRILVKAGKAGGSVTNAGAIRAANAELRAHSGHVYALAQNRKGSIQVTGVKKSGGRVFLTATGGKVVTRQKITAKRRVIRKARSKAQPKFTGGSVFINADIVNASGLIDVSGETGGNIDIGAKQSITIDNAILNASGIGDAGQIRLGGEYQGGDALAFDEVQNTNELLVTETVELNASSQNGDAGTVIAWSDGNTYFGADVDVSAGVGGGDGGFVETSGKVGLAISADASVNALSIGGRVGDWLLDPQNVTIANGGDTGMGALLDLANGADTTTDLIVDADALNTATANINIIASNAVTFDEAVNIVEEGVGLSVTADHLITVNESITTNRGDVSFTANNMEIGAAIDVGRTSNPMTGKAAGTVTLTQNAANRRISLGTENEVELSLTMAEIGQITAGTLNIGDSNSGAITVSAALDSPNVDALTLTSGGAVTFDSTVDGAFDLTVNTADVTRFNGAVGSTTALISLTTDAAGSTELAGGNFSFDGNTVTFNDAVTLTANTNISDSGDITFNNTVNGAFDLGLTSTSGAVTFGGEVGGTSALNSLSVTAQTVNLDANVTATNGISSTATRVNVLSSTGGFEFTDALDLLKTNPIAADNATIDLAMGSYGSFLVDKQNVTVRGQGNTTVVNAASPAITVAANGVTVSNMLLQGTGIADDIGVLLDGASAPMLTGVSIVNVDFADLDDGVRSRGNIGDGIAANVDVTIRGNSAADKAVFEDFLGSAIDVGDTNGDAVYLVQDVIVRDGDGNNTSTNGPGMRFRALGGAAVRRAEISQTQNGSNGITFADQTNATIDILESNIVAREDGIGFGNLAGGTVTIANNSVIRGTGNPNGDGISFEEISNGAEVNIAGNNLIRGRRHGIDFAGNSIDDSTVNIAGNATILGNNRNGVNVSASLLESTLNIGNRTITVDGVATGFDGNRIIGERNGVFLSDVTETSVTISNNDLIRGRRNNGIVVSDAVSQSSDIAIVGNTDIRGFNGDGILFRGTVAGTPVAIAQNSLIRGFNGIRFASAVRSDVTIGTATVTVDGNNTTFAGNNVIRGFNDGISVAQFSSSRFVVSNNELIRGRTDDGIDFNSGIDGEALVDIVGNDTIRGDGDHGINVDGSIDSSFVKIGGNNSILGIGRDGIHLDGPIQRFSGVVIGQTSASIDGTLTQFGGNRLIRGFQDGIDVSFINNGTLDILNNRRIRGVTENGIEFDGEVQNVLGDVLSNSARVVIDRNRRINGGQQGDGIQVNGNIVDTSTMTITRNREVTGNLNGMAFLGSIEGDAALNIDRNGRARQSGANYNGTDPVNDTFTVTRRVAGTLGAAVLFNDQISGNAEVSISRNMLTGGNNGIVFNGVSTAPTTLVHNNFIGQGTGIGVQFKGDIASQIEVFQNYISGNAGDGIFVGAAAGIGAGNVFVNQNFIPGEGFFAGNGGLAVNHQGTGTIDIEGNWWGSQQKVDIAAMLANVALPSQVLATGIDSNIELALGATNFDPFAFQGGDLIEPTDPVDPVDPVVPTTPTRPTPNTPVTPTGAIDLTNIECDISLDENDPRAEEEELLEIENRIKARCTEDRDEIGEISYLIRN